MDRWELIDKIISKVEQFVLSLLLILLILIAFSQIVLRNFWDTGLSWGDPLVRYLVVWVAFIGAALAVKEEKHISIDLFSQWARGMANILIKGFNQLFSTVICGLLAYAAFNFTRNEALMGKTTFFGVPSWMPQIIIPISFGLMALRFGFRFLNLFSRSLPTGADRGHQKSR